MVPKKIDANGQHKFRLVVDYRKLNERTVENAYPMQDITQILDQLGQAKYISCQDFAMGYHQIDMDPSDIDKTAFSTKEGHWAYKNVLWAEDSARHLSQNDEECVKWLNRHEVFCFP